MFDYTEKILHIWQRGGKWSLNLKEQIYMLSLERHSNITRAAKELGISQPALTTFLNHLEKDLDVKLFDRSAVPMKLTPAGELYINKAKKMLCIKEEFDRELQVLKKRDLSCIRVGIQQIRAPHVVPPLTMAVKQEFPKLDVVFNENHGENLFKMLEKGEIDLLLHNHMRQIPGISAEFLMKDRLLFITPKNHLLNAYGIRSANPYPWIDLSWFKDENFMLLPEAYTLREHAEQLFSSLGWRPETIEIYTRTETILRLVTAGAGVGFIFESYLSYFNEERKPACFLIGNPPITVDYMAFYPEKMKQYPVFTRFLDMIRFVLSK